MEQIEKYTASIKKLQSGKSNKREFKETDSFLEDIDKVILRKNKNIPSNDYEKNHQMGGAT